MRKKDKGGGTQTVSLTQLPRLHASSRMLTQYFENLAKATEG